MEPEEYIERLQQVKDTIADTDEQNLVQLLRIKLKGEAYNALKRINIPTIDVLIESIRNMCEKSVNVAETCEFCGNTSHTTRVGSMSEVQ